MSAYGFRDPLELLFRRLDNIGNVPGFGTQEQPAYPPLSEEEFQGTLRGVLDKSLGGLQWVGETLDKPGRAVRGLLAGRPEELLNLIPFSDTLGITDPEKSVSGRQLLEEYGALDANQEGLDAGDVAGFAAEVLLDPTTYLSLGGSAATKAGRFAHRIGLHQDDILKAAAKKLGKPVSEVGMRQAGLNVGIRDVLREMPKGARRAKFDEMRPALEALGMSASDVMKGPLSGVIGINPPFGEAVATFGKAGGLGEAYAQGMDALGKYVSKLPPVALARSLFDRNVLGAVDPFAQDVLGRSIPKTRAEQKALTQQMFDLFREHPELKTPEMNEAVKAFRQLGPDYVNAFRDIGIELPQLSDNQMDSLLPLFGDSKEMMARAKANGLDIGKRGVDTSEYNVDFAHYGASLPDEMANKDLSVGKPGSKRFKMRSVTLTGRDSATADVPYGEVLINRLSKDGRFVGDKRMKLDDAAATLMSDYYSKAVPELQDVDRLGMETALDERAMVQGIGKPATKWEKAVVANAGPNQWNQGALRKAVREWHQELYGQYQMQRAAAQQFNESIDGVMRMMDPQLKRAILNDNIDVAHPLFQRFDELHQELAGMFPGVVPNTPEELRDLLARGRAELPKSPGRRPTAELVEEVAQDLGARNQYMQNVVGELGEGTQTVLHHYDNAQRLAKWLGKRDPRHVEHGIGQFEQHALRNHRDNMAALTMTVGLSDAAHDMLAQAARVVNQGEAVPEGFVKVRDAIKGVFDKPKEAMTRQAKLLVDRFGAAKVGDVYVPSSLVEEANKLLRRWSTPEEITALGKGIDKMTGWFKTGVTMWPAFHVRNFYSGVVQNVMNGLVGIRDVVPMNRIAKQLVNGVETVEGLAKRFPRLGATDAEATQALKEMLGVYGVWQHTFNDEAVKGASQLFPEANYRGVEAMLPTSQPVTLSGAMGNLASGIKGAGLQNLNPMSGKNVLSQLSDAHGQVGDFVEGMNRISGYLGAMKKGYSPSEAAEMVKAAQVSYENLTNAESKIFRRVFPFWSFSRGIAENVASQLMQHPGGVYAQTVRATNKTRGSENFLPDYVGEGLAIPTGKEGQYITQIGLAHEAPFEWFALTPTLGGTVKRFAQKVASNMSPYLKAPIEQATGVNLFTGRPQEELYQFPFSGETGAGRLANSLLGNSPLSRAAFTARRIVDERKDPAVKGLGLVSGIGVTDLTGGVEKAMELQGRKAVEEILKQSPRIRESRNLYVPKELKGQETADEKLYMRFVQTLQKKRRDAAKQKQLQGSVSP